MPWLSNDDLAALTNAVLVVDVVVLAWPRITRWFDRCEWIGNIDFAWRRHRAGRGVRR